MPFVDCLEQYSGLLTFLVTFAYTITTVFILRANKRAADAAFAQIEESKRQFAEENRPRIVAEFLYEKRCFLGVRFVNEGRHIANRVSINLDKAFIDSLEEPDMRSLLEKQEGKFCIIGVGQHYDLFFGTNKYKENKNKLPISGSVCYEFDGKEYEDVFYIDAELYATIFSVNTEAEDFMKRVDKQTQEIKAIRNELSQIKNKLPGEEQSNA